MKKLIFSIYLGLFLMATACNSVDKGVKVVVGCCKAISAAKKENNAEEDKLSDNTSLLPVNVWDGKMLTW